MPRKRRSRVYWRAGRAYGDFRDFADVGGRQEPLVLKGVGEKYATRDPDIANKLATDRLAELELRRRNKTLIGFEEERRLGEYVEHHVAEKKAAGRTTQKWVHEAERHLDAATDFFGSDRTLDSISVREVQAWVLNLLEGRGRDNDSKLSQSSARKYLNSLSNLYRRAQAESVVVPGFNPVAAMLDKPADERHEARWLEVHEAALVLEAARLHVPVRGDALPAPMLHAMIATFLLTGGRKAEVLGLEVDDVSFDRRTITFRPNDWRRLKTRGSARVVPLWPQLEEILRAYVFGANQPPKRLLFPATRVNRNEEKMVNDLRKTLDSLAERCGRDRGTLRTKMFRHTYTAARLQTTEHGAPVSPFTVMREMGHSSLSMIEQVYGHLGDVRHRSSVVEYRVEQHAEKLKEPLRKLRGRVHGT